MPEVVNSVSPNALKMKHEERKRHITAFDRNNIHFFTVSSPGTLNGTSTRKRDMICPN